MRLAIMLLLILALEVEAQVHLLQAVKMVAMVVQDLLD
jgi:hypothetical protein